MKTTAATLALLCTVALHAAQSGTQLLSPEVRAQQLDEAANPGMLWVLEGAQLWNEASVARPKSCASCHGEAEDGMRGVAVQYPKFGADAGTLLNLEGRINRCRTLHQGAQPLPYESDELLALTAFVARQSLGMPLAVAIDGAAAPFYAAGDAFYHRRQGQLNLSCAQCHDNMAGRHLRGDVISQGHPTGYPAYRIEWQSVGSLHRRLRACSLGVRAVQFDYGSLPYLGLELYLARRAQGLPIETPAIRK